MVIVYFLICLFATAIGAASGVGGGIIIKPLMDTFSGLSIATINFLSGCTVFIMSAVALISSRNSGVNVDKRRGAFLSIGAVAGGMVGKYLFNLIKDMSADGKLIGRMQSATLTLLTLAVLIYMVNKYKVRTFSVKNPLLCILAGLILGLLGSLLGIGGGPINLMLLHFMFSMDTKTAAINSLFIIFFSQAAGVVQTVVQGVPNFEIVTLISMAIGGVAGAFLGRRLNKELRTKQLDLLFLLLMIAIIGINVYNFFKL